MNQICPKWFKMDQTWSNLISDKIIIQTYHQIFNFIYLLINQICQNGSNMINLDFWQNNQWNISFDFQLYLFLYQIEPDLSKMDQIGSNLIKLNFWWNSHWNISSDFHLYLSFDQIEPDLYKIFNMIKSAISIKFIGFSFLSLQSFT